MTTQQNDGEATVTHEEALIALDILLDSTTPAFQAASAGDGVRAYIAQQQARDSELAAVRLELERVDKALAGVDRDTEASSSESVQKVILELLTREHQLTTERTRAEEAERQRDEYRAGAQEEASNCGRLMSQRREALARVARLEEALRDMMAPVRPVGAMDRARAALSAAPQASTEQCGHPAGDSYIDAETHREKCGACDRFLNPAEPQGRPEPDYVTRAELDAYNDRMVAALRSVCRGYDPTEGMFRELAEKLENLK